MFDLYEYTYNTYRYVDRVVELQMADHQSRQSRRELEVRLTEQEREVGRLERSLKQATAAGERQILLLQKVCVKIQVAFSCSK